MTSFDTSLTTSVKNPVKVSLKIPLRPSAPFTARNLTDDQKYFLTQGWPFHSFDYPVEVLPGLWLSGIGFENDLPGWCYKNGFSHILNASGSYAQKMFYRTKPSYYDIKYLELDIEDTIGYPLQPYLSQAHDFIDNGLTNEGKVLIHCIWGQSRSVSCLIYFIMIKWGIKYDEALSLIRKVRPNAKPNSGFDTQLRAIDIGRRNTVVINRA